MIVAQTLPLVETPLATLQERENDCPNTIAHYDCQLPLPMAIVIVHCLVVVVVLVGSGQMKTSTPHVTLPDGEWTVGLCRYRVDTV